MSKSVTLVRDKMSMLKIGQIAAPPLGQAELNDRALVVNCGQVERLYGRWDVLFGAWERQIGEEQWREALPQVPVLTPTGRWRTDVLRSFIISGQTDPPDPVSLSSVDAYFSLIPTHIRRLAAPFCAHQWLMMDLMWMVPEFLTKIDEVMNATGGKPIECSVGIENLCGVGRDDRLRLVCELLS